VGGGTGWGGETGGAGDAVEAGGAGGAGDAPICSARGCRAPAAWSLRWNNPRLHEPERRKTWLACAAHRDTLGDFLRARGFLREVAPLDRSPTLEP
jgi:hypothetical protein